LNRLCPICSSEKTKPFFEIKNMPIFIGVLYPDQESALNCPRGDIQLSFCMNCGFIWNSLFDADRLEYSTTYDNSLHFSPFYDNYASQTAKSLVERYSIHDAHIIEIGCGKGDFLIHLCKHGSNHGTGFDPSFEERGIDGKISDRVTFIRDAYSSRYAHIRGDLICSRYVLEHIQDPLNFLRMLRDNVARENTVIYFEVPNADFIFSNLSIWDIIYEHCSYFTSAALTYLFRACSFKVLEVEAVYGSQYIRIEAVPGDNFETDVKQGHFNGLRVRDENILNFPVEFENKIAEYKYVLRNIGRKNKKTVPWGAGAKGVSFLNMLDIGNEIKYVVDVNPHKHGKYIPGTGQKIVSPHFIKAIQPDTVIIMNPIYEEEIRSEIFSMGVNTEIIKV